MIRVTVVLLAPCLLSGCISVQSMAQPLPPPAADEALVLMRVIPPDARLVIREGEIFNGQWKPYKWHTGYEMGADNGHVVFRLPAGKLWAVERMTVHHPDGDSNLEFRPCNGLHAITFESTAASHSYVADILARLDGDRLSVQYLKDTADVREHPQETGVADGGVWHDQPYQLVLNMQSCVDKVPTAVKMSRRVRKYR